MWARLKEGTRHGIGTSIELRPISSHLTVNQRGCFRNRLSDPLPDVREVPSARHSSAPSHRSGPLSLSPCFTITPPESPRTVAPWQDQEYFNGEAFSPAGLSTRIDVQIAFD